MDGHFSVLSKRNGDVQKCCIYSESAHVRAYGLDETNVGSVGPRRNARTCTDSL
jgi:hypothetical protein